jgi:FlaA1/EpsC-like NDP-sugar epimerase
LVYIHKKLPNVTGRTPPRVRRFILEISKTCNQLIIKVFAKGHGLKIFAPKMGVFVCVKCLALLALVMSHRERSTVNVRSSCTLNKPRPPPL